MPTDGLSLSVLIGSEIELARVLERRAEIANHLLTALGQLVGRFESVVDVDREALGGEVGDMADRGPHVELVAEEAGDRLRLRW